jgi:hypothetical protein
MASIADTRLGQPQAGGGPVAFIDRWIWVFMAGLLFVTVLVGFVPDSFMKLGLIEAGKRPPFPAVLHVHAVLMGAFVSLLLVQSLLMATGRQRWHMQLGMVSFALAPAIVLTGFVLVPVMFTMGWNGLHAANPSLPRDAIPPGFEVPVNIVLYQIRSGVLFSIFITVALLARKTNPGLHKRLMILAVVAPVSAATQRMGWLPTTVPASPLTLDIYPQLLVLPMFVWDLYRLGRIHRAYLIWLSVLVPCMIATELLWGTPWWMALVPRMMGVV